MLRSARGQVAAIVILAAAAAIFMLADALPPSVLRVLPAWLPLKVHDAFEESGGSVIVLQMDTATLRRNWLDALCNDVRSELESTREGPAKAEPLGYASLDIEKGAVRLVLHGADDMGKALPRLKSMAGAGDLTIEPDGGAAVSLKLTEAAAARRTGVALQGATAIFRRLIMSLGTEPVIAGQGADRVLVQVPGAADPGAFVRLLGKTPQLTFHAVDGSMTVEEAKVCGIPSGSVLYESEDPANPHPYLVKREAVITGEDFAGAHGELNKYSGNQPAVEIRFTPAGARKFAEFTKANVGHPVAIVLNRKVISAPVIREPIYGSSVLISGNFSLQSASELAAELSACALPAPFTVTESRYQPPRPAR